MNPKQIVAALFLMICLFAACKRKPQTAPQEKKAIPTQTVSDSLPQPQETVVDILLPAGYRGTKPADFQHMLKEDWFDFYQDTDTRNFFLKKASVHISRYYDGCIEDSTTSVQSMEGALLLIKGLTPNNARIKSVSLAKESVFAGGQLDFSYNQKNYVLRATGKVAQSESGNDFSDSWDHVTNYELYLFDPETKTEQLLVQIPRFKDTQANLLFVGDLDEDGKPDFLIETSTDYEEKRVELFLSSVAEKGKLIKRVGVSEYQFDC